MAETLATTIKHGIADRFLHRSLLWQREGDDPLNRITHAKKQRRNLPSWSWMGYMGKIGFMGISKGWVAWSQALQFPKKGELRCQVRDYNSCKITRDGKLLVPFQDGDENTSNEVREDQSDEVSEDMTAGKRATQRGLLRLDYNRFEGDCSILKCVVIGRQKKVGDWTGSGFEKDCYVMVVKRNRRGHFERVGVGTVDSRLIRFDRPGIEAKVV